MCYLTRYYRWLYTSRACAVFYVPSRNQHLIRSSLPTSHGFQVAEKEGIDGLSSATLNQGRFAELFNWTATVDQTPCICVAEAINFRKEICAGEKVIRQYCFRLTCDGGAIISDILGTEVMQNPESALTQCYFTNVRLSLPFHEASRSGDDVQSGLDPADGPAVTKWIMHCLMYKFDT